MTPMIDIVFNLIIFFILMPSFEAKEGYLPSNLPSDTGTQSAERKDLNKLRIDIYHVEPYPEKKKEARVVLNGEPMNDYAELRKRLRETRRALSEQGRDIEKVPVVIS
ncbi:MAG TPA: biopolymer transporter ExbD, partial [Phycisphaerae bacterium]|nr:biopolymer transporter ExbD [Phycisphaerae bacterium]